MFTPTALLQQYVKEAFSREGVPASDEHVRTWSDYRWEFARNKIGLLRTPTKQSGFVLRETVDYLKEDIEHNLTGWFDDYQGWQEVDFVHRLRNAAEQLTAMGESESSELGESFLNILEPTDTADPVRIFRACRTRFDEVQRLTVNLKSEIDEAIRSALVLQVNLNNNFLDELVAYLAELEETTRVSSDGSDGGIEEEEDEDDEDEEARTPRTGRRYAETAFRRAVRAQARAAASGRSIRRHTTTGSLIEWIGDRGLVPDRRMEIGKKVLLRAGLRPFASPVKLYVEGIGARYRRYRRARQSEDRWYRRDANPRADVYALELDMLLLSILKVSRELLVSEEVRQDITSMFWSVLRPVQDSYGNQIFVDEATDFSPVQLSCMSALSHPATRSFFACGDFNQRLTGWGTRSTSEIAWVDPGIGVEEVTIGYRQSRELNAFARQMVRITGGTDHSVVLPEQADRDGVRPLLAEGMSNNESVCEWLGNRIIEIEDFVGQLPSIAILVSEEAQVEPVAKMLGAVLASHNVNVVACPNGRALGQDNDIRVFDAQHIKGLEFEAVFFKDVDQLAALYPDLFDKFLYVGATRAATYLGLTCSAKLPAAIDELRSMFSSKWSD